MTDKELRKLSRKDLMQILLEQSWEIRALREELAQKDAELADRKIKIENAGSIAEAALQLSGIFEAAEAACKQYKENLCGICADGDKIRTESNEAKKEANKPQGSGKSNNNKPKKGGSKKASKGKKGNRNS